MKRYYKTFLKVSTIITFILFVLIDVNCQFDYHSPNPGIIQIKLKTISNNIEFTELNNFVIKITGIEAVITKDKRVAIFNDLKAIESKTLLVNTLDFRARDSSLIIGETYVPPGDYMGVNMLIEPSSEVILDGYRIIKVNKPDNFNSLLTFKENYHVDESRTTTITLTIDLDKTLIKGAFAYTFDPVYYISSIK